jgi:N-methylhydantoinase B
VERPLEIKPAGVNLAAGERIIVETPGAGGYGPPKSRDPDAVARDAASGKFSPAYLRRHYAKADPD